jgi:hypothetical protein
MRDGRATEEDPEADGLVTVRGGLGAAVHGVRTAPPYLTVAAVAAALAVAAGYGSVRSFGLR